MNREKRINEGIRLLKLLGMPDDQINQRSSLTLLALLNLRSNMEWSEAGNPLIGITPIMTFAKEEYNIVYAPNSREIFRRFTMHQFVEAGIAVANPDKPDRPTNSPKYAYQVEPNFLQVARCFNTSSFDEMLTEFSRIRARLVDVYARERSMEFVPVSISSHEEIKLTPGKHNALIRAIVEEFSPRFIPNSELIYIGDTGNKWGYFDQTLSDEIGIDVEAHGKMPDVIFYYREKEWLILIESVTTHGPVDHKRRIELERLFSGTKLGLVYVSAFINKKTAKQYMKDIAWETEVWIASNPTHMIHFNGDKFLGPHTT